MFHRIRLLTAAAASCLLPLAAQCPPGARLPSDIAVLAATPAPNGPADQRWRLGRDELQAGRGDAAVKHLLAALEFHPDSPALLLDLLRATAETTDARELWCERFVRAATDAKGKLALDAATRKLLPAGVDASLAEAQRLAERRSIAVGELRQQAEKLKLAGKGTTGNAAVLRFHAELALRLMDGAPSLLRSEGPVFQRLIDAAAPEHDVVLQALGRLLRRANNKPAGPVTGATPAPDDAALRAARILAGLARQARFHDLQGPPPPDLGKLAEEAVRLLADLSAATVAATKVWSIDELQSLTAEQRAEFTLRHRHWRSPAVANSTTGKYRIETVCGFETLLAAAQTVELHHARLVDHFGSDPFAERPGIVRIVPEHAELETEGAPFWWAGGFQSGDRTTIRFAWGSVPSMGRLLTHELTHRFDGVLHAFAPSWYGEGHAQWTAGHYGKMAETKCTEDHLDIGTVAHTCYKGYADPQNLRKLLSGQIKDYRDNYPAGYSLYAFLRGHPPEQPRFRSALLRYEQNLRAGQKDPVAYFTGVFCDGKEGRPASFDAFVEQWARFLRACYDWLDDRKAGNEWLSRYQGLAREHSGIVLDEPTWSWARQRNEPFFGQDHAAAAAALLQSTGEREAAVAAGLWALSVDGWRPTTAAIVVAELRALGRDDAAHAMAALRRLRFPDPDDSAPLADDAAATRAGNARGPRTGLPRTELPKTAAFLDALAAAAQAQRAAGNLVTAGAWATSHDRAALLLGRPLLGSADLAPPPLLPRHLGGFGWTETSLSGFDDRRVRGLWYATDEGDLHVGREQPRGGTGIKDRAAHQRDAFVHTVEWLQPGHYRVRGKVHFTTAYVSGAIVFGHTRRDRDLRLLFNAGDFRYAIGKDDADAQFRNVRLRLQGLWERDDQLPDAAPAWTVDLGKDVNWFEFELHVQGPRVLLAVNGEALLRYAVHDGTPIEGHVGVAMSMGAVRVQQPTVQRLDGTSAVAGSVTGLDLERQPLVPLDDLLLLPVRGVPLDPCGTLVLWLPQVEAGADPGAGLPRALPVLAQLLRATHDYPQQVVLAVPQTAPAALVDGAQARLQELRSAPLPTVGHRVAAPFAGPDPWVLFVDAHGVLRAAAEAFDPQLHSKVQKWARLFRAR